MSDPQRNLVLFECIRDRYKGITSSLYAKVQKLNLVLNLTMDMIILIFFKVNLIKKTES